MKIGASFSAKVGDANYGSHGASVYLEQEMPDDTYNDNDVVQLIATAKALVMAELAGTGTRATEAVGYAPAPSAPSAAPQTHPQAAGAPAKKIKGRLVTATLKRFLLSKTGASLLVGDPAAQKGVNVDSHLKAWLPVSQITGPLLSMPDDSVGELNFPDWLGKARPDDDAGKVLQKTFLRSLDGPKVAAEPDPTPIEDEALPF